MKPCDLFVECDGRQHGICGCIKCVNRKYLMEVEDKSTKLTKEN